MSTALDDVMTVDAEPGEAYQAAFAATLDHDAVVVVEKPRWFQRLSRRTKVSLWRSGSVQTTTCTYNFPRLCGVGCSMTQDRAMAQLGQYTA